MKTIALTLIAASLGLAQNGQRPKAQQTDPNRVAPTHKSAQQTPAKAAAPVAQKKSQESVTSIPEGAKLVEPNTYRFTDSGGKTWMYKQTPFGISRWEDVPVETQQPAAATEPTTITDLGDSLRFERKTAFGPSQWVRKKTELTEEEKALVAAQHEAHATTATKKSEQQ
jgi:hypothetical protein